MAEIVTAERAALSVEKAAAMLAACRTVGEAKDIRDKAKAVAVYLRTKKGAQAAQRDAAEIIVRADLRIGQIQRETPKAKGTVLAGRDALGGTKKSPPKSAPTLADQGITKRESAVTQRAARVAEESPKVVDAFFASARKTGRAPSTAALATLADVAPKKAIEVIERSAGKAGAMKAYVRQAEKAETAKKIEAEPAPMPTGPFRVIVADPPWQYDKRAGDATHRGDLPYPSMTVDAICALNVRAMAHPEGSVLWLWTTNAFMRDAYRVLDAWGFAERTILTWVKDRMGLGDWLRGQTEHAILAVRGTPTITLTNQTTALHGPVREHSRKPDEFYALVETLCPGSKVEMFCRTPRPGWARWGAESDRFAESAA
jgi:N6-adenosine-specific RNA methylase IME4